MVVHPNVLVSTSASSELPNISGSTGPEKIQVAPEAVQTAKDKMARVMTQLSTLREVSKSSGPSQEDVVKATKVSCMLAGGISQVAEGFVGDSEVCESITKHFIQQIEGLEMSLRRMDIQETYGDGKNSVALGLTKLNEILGHYDFKGLGGFDRIGTSSIFEDVCDESPLGLLQMKEKAEKFDAKAKADLDKLKLKETTGEELTPEDKARKETLEEWETASIKYQDTEEDVIKSIELSKLKEQVVGRLETLKDLAKTPASNPVERMMNVLQQVSLGAWIFNDIVPPFGEDMKTNPLASLVQKGTFLGDVSALNKMARKTPMFTEASFYEDEASGEVCFLGKKVKDLFSFPHDEGVGDKKWEYAVKLVTLIKKCGLRGRPKIGAKNGGTHPLVVPEIALWNGTEDKSNALLKTGDKLPETAIVTDFVPKVTARGDALPEEVIDFINEYKEYCGNFIELLQENGLLEGTEIGGFISAPSYAKFIDDAGFPTYCSVSGTTGELVCSLYCNNDTKPEIEKTLNGIRELAKNPDDIEEKNFSQFFAPIATFMEVGHFHTTAEVLGGFYSIAFALTEQEAKEKGEQPPFGEGAQRRYAMQNGFENLLIALRDHPECFLGSLPAVEAPKAA